MWKTQNFPWKNKWVKQRRAANKARKNTPNTLTENKTTKARKNEVSLVHFWCFTIKLHADQQSCWCITVVSLWANNPLNVLNWRGSLFVWTRKRMQRTQHRDSQLIYSQFLKTRMIFPVPIRLATCWEVLICESHRSHRKRHILKSANLQVNRNQPFLTYPIK